MRKTCLMILLLVLNIPAIALVRSASAAADPPDQGVETETAATEGLLPVPEYSGDWKNREFLSGDWGGTRGKWADKGLTFDFHWLQVGQGIVSGGVEEDWAYVTNLDYYINLDLMRMNVLPGALIAFRGQSRFGATVNGETGLLLPVNTYSYFPFTTELDDDVPFTITELNYTQFLTDQFGLLLGKVTTMKTSNEFAGGEGRTQFMNFQLSYSGVFGQVVPYSTLAAAAVWLPSPKAAVTTMFMNTTDASTSSGFGDIGDGITWWNSVDYQYRAGRLPGGGTVGFAFAFDGDFARIGGIYIDPGLGISLEKKSQAWAGSWSAWQYVYLKGDPPELIDPTDGRQDLEGLGVFWDLGLADESTNPTSFSVAAGLSGRGMIPRRGNDTYGLGYFYNDLQDPRSIALSELEGSAQGLEVYYNLAIAQSIAFSLDFQWTQSAVREIDDAIMLGARLNIRF